MKPIDPLTEIRVSDAARMLGYKSTSTLAGMVRAGRIPGARRISTKIVVVPLAWVQVELAELQDASGKVGKPRGYTAKK